MLGPWAPIYCYRRFQHCYRCDHISTPDSDSHEPSDVNREEDCSSFCVRPRHCVSDEYLGHLDTELILSSYRTVIVSCLRLAYVFRLLQSADPSWDYASIGYALWVLRHSPPKSVASDNELMPPTRHLEANLSIICGCTPTLKKFIQRLIPGPLDSGLCHETAESRSNKRSTYRQCEGSIEMHTFTRHKTSKTHPVKEETRDTAAESVHGDDHSDRAILETKVSTSGFAT